MENRVRLPIIVAIAFLTIGIEPYLSSATPEQSPSDAA
jgi:hypothetical protein